MKNLRGKVALVTGAAGGLGGAVARRFASEGMQVVMTDIAQEAGAKLADEINATFLRQDVAEEEGWQYVTNAALSAHGRIDILVNAAGIEGDLNNSKLDTTYEHFRKVCSVNLDGTFLGCMTVMPHMMEQGKGTIVNISSIVSFMATPSAIPYGVSKAGVEQLTRSLAIIGAENGNRVRANSIHPGVIKTRMTDNIIQTFAESAGISDQEAEAGVNSAVPFGERGEPEDIANMIAFLASDEAGYITGASFRVDGGWSVTSAG